MLLYSDTGKTKTGEFRTSRSIGALLIEADIALDALTNETITVYVERANGSNTAILTNHDLKAFIAKSIVGEAAASITAGSFSAICELAFEGNITLGENEGIKIAINNLKSAQVYSIYGIEYPIASERTLKFETKKILTDEVSRKFDVEGFDVALLTGISALQEIQMSFGTQTVKYVPAELKAIARDIQPIIGAGTNLVLVDLADSVLLPLTGVTAIDIYKDTSSAITLHLKDVV